MNAQRLTVALGERSYPIDIGHGTFGDSNELRRSIGDDVVLIVTNETVAPLYLERLFVELDRPDAAVHVLPDGERYKTLSGIEGIYEALYEARATRQSCLVALGGGVVGDMTGFAAASYLRGIDFVQIPTTLLAQVDSSVGGKTGVNLPGGKNLVGAFHQPRYVAIDTLTLTTLPDRELSAGLAEVIKHALLADAPFFDWLESNIGQLLQRDAEALGHAVHRCCDIKARIVAADEREAGQRALLNLGHTFGHAIERVKGYGDWLHGEAVAAGLMMAARVSALPAAECERLQALLAAARLPTAPPPVGAAPLAEAMRADKKVRDRQIRLILLERIGRAYISSDYDAALVDAVLAQADG